MLSKSNLIKKTCCYGMHGGEEGLQSREVGCGGEVDKSNIN